MYDDENSLYEEEYDEDEVLLQDEYGLKEYVVEGLHGGRWEIIYHADSYAEAVEVMESHYSEAYIPGDGSDYYRDYRISEDNTFQ